MTYFSFYKVNSVCRFRHSRPFHKGEKDKSNEFKTLWLERTIYVTNGKFPGLLKSFPVKSSEIRDVTSGILFHGAELISSIKSHFCIYHTSHDQGGSLLDFVLCKVDLGDLQCMNLFSYFSREISMDTVLNNTFLLKWNPHNRYTA